MATRQFEQDWHVAEQRFEPAIALTLVLGMAASVFLAFIA